MKILVCISQVPDTTSKISFSDNNTTYNTAGVTMIINPYDEWYALVRALELKEADASVAVHLVTVGKADADPVIRKALALGGDEAFRINAETNDPYVVASQIASFAKEGGYDLILCGKESIDYNNGVVPAMLAELIDANYTGMALKLDLSGHTATVTCEIEGGEEVVEADLPLVVSCQKGMAEPRIPNMRGIMAARSKPLNVVTPMEIGSLTNLVIYDLPPAKTGVKMFKEDDLDALVQELHNVAKVI